MTPPNYRDVFDAARKAAGIDQWPQNALRHSFASYHLAKFNDAAALALELGHTNSDLVFQHYRQLVRPKQAERYWKSPVCSCVSIPFGKLDPHATGGRLH